MKWLAEAAQSAPLEQRFLIIASIKFGLKCLT